jgi:hypothetical protein
VTSLGSNVVVMGAILKKMMKYEKKETGLENLEIIKDTLELETAIQYINHHPFIPKVKIL